MTGRNTSDMPANNLSSSVPGSQAPHGWPIDPQTLNYMASIVQSSDDAIIGKTLDGTVTIWNPGAERMYGYSSEEMVGKSIMTIVPKDRIFEVDQIAARLADDGHIEPYETLRIHKNGSEIGIFLRVSAIRDGNNTVIGASSVARDITNEIKLRREMAEMRAAADRRAVVMETASHVALDILASRTGVEALKHIADAARTLAGAKYAALGVARQDGNGLMEFATVGMSAEEEAQVGSRPTGIGILGLLLNRSAPLRVDSLSDHAASVGFPANHPPMDAFLGVPIRRGDTTLGSLYLTNKLDGGPFTIEDEIAVQALGSYAAVAIHNLQMLARQRGLVGGLIAAQEEERRAVAYELHDGLTQFVMASYAHMETYRRAVATGQTEKAEKEMNQGLSYLKEAVVESRRMVNGLRSLALDDLGLAGALEQLLAEEKLRAGWQAADLIHNIADERFDPRLESTVYRVVQEAVANARKHANAQRIRVSLISGRDEFLRGTNLTLEVKDWGSGFLVEQKQEDYAHFGLHCMSERVKLIGGAYEVESEVGKGTTVRAVIPVLDTAT